MLDCTAGRRAVQEYAAAKLVGRLVEVLHGAPHEVAYDVQGVACLVAQCEHFVYAAGNVVVWPEENNIDWIDVADDNESLVVQSNVAVGNKRYPTQA